MKRPSLRRVRYSTSKRAPARNRASICCSTSGRSSGWMRAEPVGAAAGGRDLVGGVARHRGDVRAEKDRAPRAVDEPRHLGDVGGQHPVALLAGPQRRPGAHVADGHAGHAAGALDQLPVGIGRAPDGAMVEREHRHRHPRRIEHRQRPARAQAVGQRQLALVAPARVGHDVLHDHRRAPRERQAARATARPAEDVVHHGHVGGGQARRRAVTQLVVLHHENGAVQSFALGFDGPAQRVEDGRERLAGGDHLQHPLLAGQQRLRPLALGDVDLEAVQPLSAERHAVAEPHHAPVGREHPILVVPVAAGGDLALDEGEDALAVVGVNAGPPEVGLGHPLLDRVAEQLLDPPAHEEHAAA